MGYADVGADIYVVLGVIALFAGVVSPLAFAIAATTYVCTGLCYAELATAYPVAGGGQYYSLKAFGRIHGFVAGWGLMLDYTIDIALFALATVGYLGTLTSFLFRSGVLLTSPYYGLTAIALILLLLALNVVGIKYSSRFNEAVVAVDLVTVALSLLSVTIPPWQAVANNSQAPATTLASNLPIIGGAFAVWVALMGTLVCYVSTNTGVIGVSRVMYSMGRLGLVPRGFSRVSSRYRTPYVTITIFTVIASLLLAVYIALPGADLLDLITSIYNFGALVAYMYVNAAAIVLRVKEPGRTGWKMPLNLTVRIGDKPYQVSVIPVVGLVSSSVVWVLIVGLHPTGRVIGPVSFAIGIAAYLIYQRYRGGSKDG